MMIVTTTELQNNFGKYINEMQNGPVYFTRNGKIAGKLVAIKGDKKEAYRNLEKLKSGLQDINEEDEIFYGRTEKYHS